MMKADLRNKSRRMPWWLQGLILFAGAAAGVAAIFVYAIIVAESSVHDALVSVHGLLVNSDPVPLTEEQANLLAELLRNGHIVSAGGQVSNITDFYASLIDTLFIVIGILTAVAYVGYGDSLLFSRFKDIRATRPTPASPDKP